MADHKTPGYTGEEAGVSYGNSSSYDDYVNNFFDDFLDFNF